MTDGVGGAAAGGAGATADIGGGGATLDGGGGAAAGGTGGGASADGGGGETIGVADGAASGGGGGVFGGKLAANCSSRYSPVILSSELDGTLAAMPNSLALARTSLLSMPSLFAMS